MVQDSGAIPALHSVDPMQKAAPQRFLAHQVSLV
jgi:hypothetical protein